MPKHEGFPILAKILLCTLPLMLFVVSTTRAQGDRGGDYYRSQYVKLYRAYLKDTNDVSLHVKLSEFYADTKNPMCNIPLAKRYISRAERKYRSMLGGNDNDKELRRLIGRGITLQSLADAGKKISQSAILKLNSEELSVVQIDQYVECFSDDRQVLRLAGLQRVKTAYRSALRQNTIDAYSSFVKQYPGTDEAKSAEKHIAILVDSIYSTTTDATQTEAYLLKYIENDGVRMAITKRQSESAYKVASSANTIESYRDFLDKYPSSPYSIAVVGRIDSLQYESFKRLRSAKDYVRFALANDGSELADKSIDELFRKVMQENDVQAALLFMQHFSLDPRYVDVYRRFFEWHAQEGSHQLIELFSQTHSDYPFKSSVTDELHEAADIEVVDLKNRYDESMLWNYSELVKTFHSKRIAYVALQRMLQKSIAERDWPSAIERCESFAGRFQGYNKEATDKMYSLLTAQYDGAREPRSVVVDGNEIVGLAVSPTGDAIYYNRLSPSGTKEIWSARMTDGEWKPSGRVIVDGIGNESVEVFSLFDGGKKMLVGVDGDIMVAVCENSSWRVSQNPPYPVNTDYIETDAFMLPDGSGMLLASDRPEGFNVQKSGMNYHGDDALATDIYFVPYTEKGWGEAVNLGFRVNTCYCERYPVLSQDLKTLFFVSDRGGGLGYGDIYVSRRSDSGDWQSWTEPTNLGKEINSAFGERGLSLHPVANTLLFCSQRDGAVGRVFEAETDGLGSENFSKVCFAETDMVDCRVFDAVSGTEMRIDFDGEKRCLTTRNGRRYAVAVLRKNHWQPMCEMVGGKDTFFVAESTSVRDLPGKSFVMNYLVFDTSGDGFSTLGRAEIENLSLFLDKNEGIAVDLIVAFPGTNTGVCHAKSVEIGEKVRNLMESYGLNAGRVTVVGRGNLDNRQATALPTVTVRFK